MFNDPSFWVGLGFIVFCGLIFKKARQLVIDSLDNYIASVRTKIDQAIATQSGAQQNLISCQHHQAHLLQQIHDINSHTQSEIQRLIQKSHDDMQIHFKNQERAFNERLHNQQQKVLHDTQQQVINIVIKTCQKLLYQSLPDATQQQLLQEVLEAIGILGNKITRH